MGAADALALVELDSIARGYRVVDALAKRSPVELVEANLVEPGRYLVLFTGGVAEVAEALDAALEAGGEAVLDRVYLPWVHPDIPPALAGRSSCWDPDTIGIVEGARVASTIEACDRALKDASVRLGGLRVAPALGGRAYFVVHGRQCDVEASLEAARAVLERREALVRLECIPRPHADLVSAVLRPAPFCPAGGG